MKDSTEYFYEYMDTCGVTHKILQSIRRKQSIQFHKALEDFDGAAAYLFSIPNYERDYKSIQREIEIIEMNCELNRKFT